MSDQNIKDLTYKIHVHDDGRQEFFLDDQPWEVIDPASVSIGDVIYFDPNGLDRYGVVANIENRDFVYYYVSNGAKLDLEEIAFFQVTKVVKPERVNNG